MRQAAFALILAVMAGPAMAATFQVSVLADSGPGSLRQAVLDANAMAGADEVTFLPGLTGTIVLTSGEIPITDDLTVSGPGAGVLTVSGNNSSRIFQIDDGTARVTDVTVSGLTLTLGFSTGHGGAIRVAGESLTVQDAVISDSRSVGVTSGVGNGRGGGIAAFNSTLTIERSTLTSGVALFGTLSGGPGSGGNLYVSGGSLTMTQSTVSGGFANLGGGVYVTGATVLFQNSTIAGNSAGGFGGLAGGLWMDQSSVDILNSTLSGNSSADGDVHVASGILNLDHAIVANGAPVDLGRDTGTVNAVYSLVENPGTAINGINNNNLFGVDPNLGPLTDNGGPTQTLALLSGSPAIDAGNPLIPNPPPTDQRGPGFARIVNGRVDLGSFEVQQTVGTIEVPALSNAGLAVLMALLAGVGLWVLRR